MINWRLIYQPKKFDEQNTCNSSSNDDEKSKHLYFMGFIAGLVVLIRPTEILILLIPLFYQVTSIKDMKLKLVKLINLK